METSSCGEGVEWPEVSIKWGQAAICLSSQQRRQEEREDGQPRKTTNRETTEGGDEDGTTEAGEPRGPSSGTEQDKRERLPLL